MAFAFDVFAWGKLAPIRKLTSGSKAEFFKRLNGTTEVVPIPICLAAGTFLAGKNSAGPGAAAPVSHLQGAFVQTFDEDLVSVHVFIH